MKKLIWILSVIFGLALLGCGMGGPNQAGDTSSSPIVSADGKTAPTFKVTQLTKADFKPSIKIKGNDCFDYYGCNRTYAVKVTTDLKKLDADNHHYEITYKVTGGRDGAQTDTITMAPDGSYLAMDNSTRVNDESVKLKVAVVEIERLTY